MIQNTYLRKYITSQCSKLSACLSSIQSGKLVIMFLIPVVLVDFHRRFEHVFASLRHICTHKGGVSPSRLYCMWGWFFSQHLILIRLTVSSNIVFISAVLCRGCWSTTHVKLIILQMTAIADFKQRWQQRGKTLDCSFILTNQDL